MSGNFAENLDEGGTGDEDGPRTQAERTARTRAALLDAAASTIAAVGYEHASLDDIAAAAGYTKGAVYANFESKQDLFLGVIEARASAGNKALIGGLARDTSIEDRLAELDVWHNDPDRGRVWALLQIELTRLAARESELAEKLAAKWENSRRELAGEIKRLQADGLELPADPDRLARELIALSDGIVMHRLIDADSMPDDMFSTALRRLLAV